MYAQNQDTTNVNFISGLMRYLLGVDQEEQLTSLCIQRQTHHFMADKVSIAF